MSVECTGRNIELSSSLKELARRQTQQLERRLGGPAVVRVVLSHEKHRFGAEVIASHRRRHWKAQEETAGDLRAAVTLAFEKIDAQAKRRDYGWRTPARSFLFFATRRARRFPCCTSAVTGTSA